MKEQSGLFAGRSLDKNPGNRDVVRHFLKGLGMLAIGAAAALICVRVWGWGSESHSQIVDAALTVIPPGDELSVQLQGEALKLRTDVQMADWVNALVHVSETSQEGTQSFPQDVSEYFANDYLIFPGAAHQFNHAVPEVLGTYEPFFLRAVQALRTETPTNAARWIGSLLHFVTDSGSPPHTIGLGGPNHAKMENWLDASRINISEYRPVLLGSTDGQAVKGLIEDMQRLIAKDRVIALRMVPFAESNDRARVEPLAMECATNTATVTADVIHTLMILGRRASPSSSGAIIANVFAPSVPALRLLPAKLVLLNTSYSTLSEAESITGDRYRGSFILHNLAPGTYRAAIERVGAETLMTRPFTVTNGHVSHFDWKMQPSTQLGNLVQNSDFRLHWAAKDAPDHWHFDGKTKSWISDNIPVQGGKVYAFWAEARSMAGQAVVVQWMQRTWKPVDSTALTIHAQSSAEAPLQAAAPQDAIFVRFRISSGNPPGAELEYIACVLQDK